MIVWYFPFHGLHFVTSLTVLTPVLCFHTTSFNYGAKVVRDVDPTCRCHQSNIMPDSIFSVNNAQCVTCGYACCYCIVIFLFFRFFYCFFLCVQVCVGMCVFRGDIRAPFIHRDKVPSFFTITIVDLGKP